MEAVSLQKPKLTVQFLHNRGSWRERGAHIYIVVCGINRFLVYILDTKHTPQTTQALPRKNFEYAVERVRVSA